MCQILYHFLCTISFILNKLLSINTVSQMKNLSLKEITPQVDTIY